MSITIKEKNKIAKLILKDVKDKILTSDDYDVRCLCYQLIYEKYVK